MRQINGERRYRVAHDGAAMCLLRVIWGPGCLWRLIGLKHVLVGLEHIHQQLHQQLRQQLIIKRIIDQQFFLRQLVVERTIVQQQLIVIIVQLKFKWIVVWRELFVFEQLGRHRAMAAAGHYYPDHMRIAAADRIARHL